MTINSRRSGPPYRNNPAYSPWIVSGWSRSRNQ
jgi:hypothetical protein